MKDDDDANDVSEMRRKKSKVVLQKPNVPCDPNRKKKANFGLLEFFAGSSKPFNFNLRFLLKSVIFAF